MTQPQRLFATSIGRCTHCKGVVENKQFVHDPNCLIKIPGRHCDLARFWHIGRNGGNILRTSSAGQHKAFEMGAAIRERLERPKPKMITFPVPYVPLESFTS